VPGRGRSYRGLVEAIASDARLRLVNQVDVETYLKGMGEVRDPTWPTASLQSQAIAARTYALRAMQSGGELCDDDHCQVYLGAQAEYDAMNKAVDASAGQVVVFGNALASTVYSTNGGGITATPQEGFGGAAGNQPYLEAKPYVTSDPLPWTVSVSLSDVASRLSYPGTLTDVGVASTGPSGRALTIVLTGDRGQMTVGGLDFARALGLRSTLFVVHAGSADTAPPPPSTVDVIQALPDEAAVVVPVPATEAPAIAAAPVIDVGPAPVAAPRPTTSDSSSGLPIGATVLAGLTLLAATGDAVAGRRHRRP